ncbi:hypothetical protein FQZ97_969840 [compost metagenome]
MQKGELLGGQVDAPGTAKGAMAAGVQFQVGHPQHLGHGGLFTATQQAAYPRQQFGKLEGFHQIVIGAQIQPTHLVHQASAGSEHHHSCGAALADVGEHAEAIHLRQAHVQYHQVIGMLPRQVDTVDAVAGAVDHIATFTQALVQIVGRLGLVLDNKDSHIDLSCICSKALGLY